MQRENMVGLASFTMTKVDSPIGERSFDAHHWLCVEGIMSRVGS